MKIISRSRSITISLIVLIAMSITSCKNEQSMHDTTDQNVESAPPDYDISLAQWSLHKSFFGDWGNDWAWFGKMLMESPDSLLRGDLNPDDFPKIAVEKYGMKVIELVNTFYYSKANDMEYWKGFKKKCDDLGVTVGLIMCDALGDLGNEDAEARNKAVENHYAWVDIAKEVGHIRSE